ncbi:MAG: hypothetical protein P8170_01455 [Gemmatimonadota bacterium]
MSFPRHERHPRSCHRLLFVRRRSELFTHIRIFHQLNLPTPKAAFHQPSNRIGVAEAVPDPLVRANIVADLGLAERLDEMPARCRPLF